jgi:hypothetical protein
MRSTGTLAATLLGAATFACPAAAIPVPSPHKPAQPNSTPWPSPPPPVVPTAAPFNETSSGFDWSSAGIGAAGGVGAFAIALAGTAGLRRWRPPIPDPSSPTGHIAPEPQPRKPPSIGELGTRPTQRSAP